MSSNDILSEYIPQFETLARDHGLDFYPVDFELVPSTFMMEVAVYGLPVRMPHWSFGVRYVNQYVQHRMGNSRIFEVIFPGNPNRAYLVTDNALAENALVSAHVLGHADFSKNNELFVRMQSQVGARIVEQAAERARTIEEAIDRHGQQRVESILDAALALEQHVDVGQPSLRESYASRVPESTPESPVSGFHARFLALPGESDEREESADPKRRSIPPHPEPDLLWFIAHYAPELEEWERDIFLAVREESFYFYPLFACQIMNEGWASYWHARLLREADFLPEQVYLEAIKAHSDVVRPYAGSGEVSLAINPYHVGFVIWRRIVEDLGEDNAMRIRAEEDDFGFVRNYLDEDVAHELGLFGYKRERRAGEEQVRVEDWELDTLREAIIAPKFNFGAPHVNAVDMGVDGSLALRHEHEIDGRGLDIERARPVLDYIRRVWRRPVRLHTVNELGAEQVLEVK